MHAHPKKPCIPHYQPSLTMRPIFLAVIALWVLPLPFQPLPTGLRALLNPKPRQIVQTSSKIHTTPALQDPLPPVPGPHTHSPTRLFLVLPPSTISILLST